MTYRTTLSALALVSAATFVVACDQSPTAVPAADEFDPAALVVPTGTNFAVQACKDGPAGTYNFDISAVTGSVSLIGSSFTLDNDQCKTVATTTASAQKVSITENVAAGTHLLQVDFYLYLTSTNTQTFHHTEYTPTVQVGNFGNDAGWVVVFRNVRDPSTGCTLTQGYWKTHSEFGPAPYDDTWATLSSGASTGFFLSGQSWYEVLWTPPSGGNAYYSLAHQYIAAYLNGAAGAGAPAAVLTAIADAEALFGAYTPDQIAALKGNNSTRKEFLTLAGILGDYNEGITGPGHCSD